jgi:ribosomal protein S18 acetylase RimI-like enzyme
MKHETSIRRAAPADEGMLRDLHRASFFGLGTGDYTAAEIAGFLADVRTVDAAMLEEGNCLTAWVEGRLAASAAWTMQQPSYLRQLGLSRPAGGRVATIRAVFTHPSFAGRGLARRLMTLCEEEAVLLGRATCIDLCATLSGLPLYRRLGYQQCRDFRLRLSNGENFRGVHMAKQVLDPGVAVQTAA